MSVTHVSPRDVAYTVRIALQAVEDRLMPSGSHSRLYAGITLAEATVGFLSRTQHINRQDLAAWLEHVKQIESDGIALNQLAPASIIRRGLSLAIHVAQDALADQAMDPEYALREARLIFKLADEVPS